MQGIVSYGAYVPYWRLQRSAIGAALEARGGKGTRAVASYDEDSTTMAVEAARTAIAAHRGDALSGVVSSTSAPPYLDKTNATAIHAALGLPADAYATDMNGSVRSAFAAMSSGTFIPGTKVVTLADVRTGLPGGTDERDGGDGAVAFILGDTDPIAVAVSAAHATGEFLDRWRVPGEPASHVWEERFGERAYVPLGEAAATDALKGAGLTAGEVDHVIVCGLQTRAVRQVAARIGARPESYAPDLTAAVGNMGSAAWGLALADVLDRAEPDQSILVVALADGADAFVYKATSAITAHRAARAEAGVGTVAEQIASGRDDLSYTRYLSWRGFLHREPPRRPDPEAYYAPPAFRNEHWKFGFEGSACRACGFIHLPPARVCSHCQTVDDMEPIRLAETAATVATYTVDRLAFSPSPPTVAAVLDFDGGGRFTCELTDLDPEAVQIGLRVEPTFRKISEAKGVHNYFWKARPIRSAGGPGKEA
jgi:3-hydroxy-3-methylglutaryl CoA synthase/uncharacterized OB-fold protein